MVKFQQAGFNVASHSRDTRMIYPGYRYSEYLGIRIWIYLNFRTPSIYYSYD